jgi:hypothetical protein
LRARAIRCSISKTYRNGLGLNNGLADQVDGVWGRLGCMLRRDRASRLVVDVKKRASDAEMGGEQLEARDGGSNISPKHCAGLKAFVWVV